MRKVGQTHFLLAFLLSPGHSWELLNQRLIEVNRHGGAFVMADYTFRWRHLFTHLFLAHKKLDRLALTHEYKCTRRSKNTVKGSSLLSTSAKFCLAMLHKDGKHPEKADLIKIFHPVGWRQRVDRCGALPRSIVMYILCISISPTIWPH